MILVIDIIFMILKTRVLLMAFISIMFIDDIQTKRCQKLLQSFWLKKKMHDDKLKTILFTFKLIPNEQI